MLRRHSCFVQDRSAATGWPCCSRGLRLAALFVGSCLFALGLFGCRRQDPAGGSGGDTGSVRAFAAASLTEPLQELAHSFEADNPGCHVELSFAGTQQLLLQLEHGAAADIFATADAAHMRAAERAGVASPGAARALAQNRLALVVPRDNPGRVESLADLGRPGLRLVVAHDGVPVGRYTAQLFAALAADPAFGAELVRRAEANVVSRENTVKAVLAKIRLGEADAGFVYASDASGPAAPELRRLELPEAHNPLTRYEIAVLERAASPELARRFVDFAQSSKGRSVLQRAGLLAPPALDGGT